MADGTPLLFLGPQTANQGGLQPVTEARVHVRHCSGNSLGANGRRNLETCPVFVAGVDDGRLPSGTMLAFVFGHLVMVVLHGWNNFISMWTGWKKDPEYDSE